MSTGNNDGVILISLCYSCKEASALSPSVCSQKCGDGVCEADEKLSCPRDCGFVSTAGQSSVYSSGSAQGFLGAALTLPHDPGSLDQWPTSAAYAFEGCQTDAETNCTEQHVLAQSTVGDSFGIRNRAAQGRD
jgi:hypothetical protein